MERLPLAGLSRRNSWQVSTCLNVRIRRGKVDNLIATHRDHCSSKLGLISRRTLIDKRSFRVSPTQFFH
ncbi:hypothetical protein, partial [Burkholderia gladioli]